MSSKEFTAEQGQSGATAVEYAIMLSLIAMAIFGTVLLLGLSLPPVFQGASDGLT